MNNWRNNLAWWICNWVLNHIADEQYQLWIDGLIRYALNDNAFRYVHGFSDGFKMSVNGESVTLDEFLARKENK